ncbi:MAG: alpha/beta hydrolase [Phycisphaerales bacterium]|jgi:uncharacterized protein|nr:alpha/beta hydrolase [Phycisphaerales bacterium]
MNRVIITLLACGFFSGCASVDRAFYHPDGKVYRTPARDGLRFEEVRFPSRDGTVLSGWFVPSVTPAAGTLIHFHGNAQNMTSHYSYVSWVPQNGFNLFVFDYRGYGASAGSPSRAGLYQDSTAAIKYVQGRDDVDRTKIIVIGQSLGGANAITALGGNKFDGIVGVVIDSAFSSYEEVGKDHVGSSLKPVAGSLLSDDYSPINVVDKISPTPLIIIHGTADRVVPYYHGKLLHERAKAPKELWTIEGGVHTDALTRHREEIVPRLLKRFRGWVAEPEKRGSRSEK